MKKITILHLEDCPYCHYARRALTELAQEDPAYGEVSVEWIEENKQPELAKPYGYSYYYVPSIFEGDQKLYEARPSEDYAACKMNVKAALDIVLDRGRD